MAFIIPTSVGSTIGGSASVPAGPSTEPARGAFDDHLKRAGQPTGGKESKQPTASEAEPPTDKPVADANSDCGAAAPANNAQADSKASAETTDSQQPVADAGDDATDDQHDPQPTGETVVIAAVVMVEEVAAPVVDELTIETTVAADTPEKAVGNRETTNNATSATKVAIEQAMSKVPDVPASTPAPSLVPVDVTDQATNATKPASKPLPQFAPSSLRTLDEAVNVNQQQAAQAVTDDSNTTAEVAPVAAEQVSAASATTPAMVTIVSAAHEAPSHEADSEDSSDKTKSADAASGQGIASVVAAVIQAPLSTAPARQPVDRGSEEAPENKRSDTEPDPVKPTEGVPKMPPAGGVDTLNNNNRLQTSFPGLNLQRQDGTGGASEVDRVRFVQRVAKAFRTAEDQGGQIRLRLNPPELGALKLEITMKAGIMTAKLEAETPAARSMLLDNLPALRERLAEQNVKVEKFDVDVMDRQPGGMPDAMPDNSERGQRSPRNFFGGENQEESTEAVSIGGRIFVDSGQLNVVI